MAKKTKYSLDFKKMCSPALIYFIISALSLTYIGFQNLNGDDQSLCVGPYKCGVASKTIVLALHFFWVMVWTFILDLVCKSGHEKLSWFIVLIPFILFFALLGLIMLQTNV